MDPQNSSIHSPNIEPNTESSYSTPDLRDGTWRETCSHPKGVDDNKADGETVGRKGVGHTLNRIY